jgi:hypothetical protein
MFMTMDRRGFVSLARDFSYRVELLPFTVWPSMSQSVGACTSLELGKKSW